MGLALEAIDIALAAPEARDKLAREFQMMHPAIVTVGNVGRLLEDNPPDSLLLALRRALVEGTSVIADHAARLIAAGARVVTLSHSSTVEAALRRSQPRQILVLESLPGGEGRTLAEKLGATLIEDARMGQAVADADLALAGIDAYDGSGAILHKVGTLPLALCCAHRQKPFYAIGHSFKLAPIDTEELLRRAGAGGSSFERIPAPLITAIVTERGSALTADPSASSALPNKPARP